MHKITLLLTGLFVVALQGCRQQPSLVENKTDPSQARLLLVGQAYRRFNREQRRPPRSPAELGPQLQQLGADQETLQSARDGKPFVVLWGLDITAPPSGTGRPVLAYEEQGQAGSRYVLSAMGNVELLPDDKLRESNFASGFQPPP